ncbi:Acyl-CoA dehydrogenase [Streptomyces sp. Ag82_O1-12]|uniref:acyl-CoA dehydrogenase family protein n=1 Tax=unclassified Streptomyces TaxID=2593676 RepID=UPI000BD11897|nr:MULTISPECIES: acyl-CoA dehydrogenase family protein [unclassified Streptomyces]SMQ17057.1 Acyl-CoA dehydrogenase [Streptomyces sp. Ag82_O1-12]SOD46086.1 Acyl-CoA dehydrogenase [Streptomyces sp. Ag82_G6-1]
MDARFTDEQDEIRRTLRELLGKRCGPEELRAAVDTPAGHDPALWTTLAEQLGLPGLALPETYGGVGCTVTELALACEETGRTLAPTPLLATAVLVAPLLLALGTDAQRAELLPRVASGGLTAALAVPGPALATVLALTGHDRHGAWVGGGRAGGVQARRAEGGWQLYGQVDQVLDGHSARLLVVAAHTGGFARSRVLLFLVRGDATGLTRVRQTALDATRPQGRIQLRHVPAELLGDETADALPALARLGHTAAACLATEAVGAAGRVLERTVEYVGQREQFGRPVGSFQAVKHRLADAYVQVQAARSAAYYAAWASAAEATATTRATTAPTAATATAPTGATTTAPTGATATTTATVREETAGGLALAQALEALRRAAAEGIQLHGGIGFTWEHEAHLYFKRAAGDELLFGPVHRLRAHAADAAHVFEEAGT